MAAPVTCYASRTMAWQQALWQTRYRRRRGHASVRKWARSAPAITISKCRRSSRWPMTRRRCLWSPHPLRLTWPRPPDRDRLSARDGHRHAAAGHQCARSRPGMCTDPVSAWSTIPWRDACRDQLCIGQPADPHPLTRRVFGHFFPQASSICCSMFRTTPASRRRIVLQGASEVCLFTGRERHAPSARAIRSCRLRSGTSASRCSSAAAWAPTRRSWPAPAMGRNTPSHRHAMVPDVNSAAIRPWALARSSGHR